MKTAIVLGKGTLAINVAASMLPNGSGYKLVGIVPVLPAPMWCEDFWSWAKWAGTGVACYEHHNDIPDVDLVVSAQYDKILKRDFLERHLCAWIPLLGQCLRRHDPHPFYAALTRLTEEFLAHERDYLGRLLQGSANP